MQRSVEKPEGLGSQRTINGEVVRLEAPATGPSTFRPAGDDGAP